MPFAPTTVFKRAHLASQELGPGAYVVFTWQPSLDVELVDVRLVDVEGNVDITFVCIGNLIQVAWSRRPRIVRVSQVVRVQVENFGTTAGACGIELDYRGIVGPSG
jgi:hypothetical protein